MCTPEPARYSTATQHGIEEHGCSLSMIMNAIPSHPTAHTSLGPEGIGVDTLNCKKERVNHENAEGKNLTDCI